MKTILLSVLALACLAIPAFADHRITPAEIAQIRVGFTTENDLLRIFGRPTIQSTDIHGRRSLDWFWSRSASPQSYIPIIGPFIGGMEVHVQQLAVILSAAGRVQYFTMNDIVGNQRQGVSGPISGPTGIRPLHGIDSR